MSASPALAHCARVARARATNFAYAMAGVPAARRASLYALYAFCRAADDAADDPAPAPARLAALRRFVEGGDPGGDPMLEATAAAIDRHALPRALLAELLAGVEQDATVTRYGTFDDLRAYCYRVASTVGLLSLAIVAPGAPPPREAAVAFGIAMQLTNILRDVREDHARGRVYLPQDELAAFGVGEAELGGPLASPAFRGLVRFQAGRARAFFATGNQVVPPLPRPARGFVLALGGLYGAILDRIEADPAGVLRRRVELCAGRKAWIAVCSHVLARL